MASGRLWRIDEVTNPVMKIFQEEFFGKIEPPQSNSITQFLTHLIFVPASH